MNVKHDQFIGIYESAYSQEYCTSVIKYFDDMQNAGFSFNRQNTEQTPKLNKDDSAVFCHSSQIISANGCINICNKFNSPFWGEYYKNYADNYSVLQSAGSHGSYHLKIQKTDIGGGYHIWHFESDNRFNSQRILAWMLYLNDVEEGGETEFLYLHKRIKPKAGTLLIWPAAFTHTHRGNPPLSNTKYIMTGWVEY
jgi:hypothetical protein